MTAVKVCFVRRMGPSVRRAGRYDILMSSQHDRLQLLSCSFQGVNQAIKKEPDSNNALCQSSMLCRRPRWMEQLLVLLQENHIARLRQQSSNSNNPKAPM